MLLHLSSLPFDKQKSLRTQTFLLPDHHLSPASDLEREEPVASTNIVIGKDSFV